MFAGKAGAYPSEAPFWLMVSLANITLGWEGLPGTNTLAFYEKSINCGCKKVYSKVIRKEF